MLRLQLRARHRDRGLHGHRHVDRQRLTAIILIITGLVRVCAWATLIALYLLGVPFTAHLFASVAFVAVISLYANAATDFGQVCASLAQLTAGDAHHDAEATRIAVGIDYSAIEADIARLAELQPCPEADQLAAEIRRRLADSQSFKTG